MQENTVYTRNSFVLTSTDMHMRHTHTK